MISKKIFTTIICMYLCFSGLFAQTVPSDTAILKTALLHLYGINRPVNYQRANKYLKFLANKNNPDALNALGVIYDQGLGVEKNQKTAVQYFYKAYKYGSSNGTRNLALSYRKGYGVKQNYSVAFALYDKLAQQGDLKAYYNAGDMLFKGYGTKQDYNKAILYFEKGAAEGDKNCLYMLGCAYLNGKGKQQDTKKSTYYFEKAMNNGHSWVEDILDQHIIDSVQQKINRNKNKSKNQSDTLVYVSTNNNNSREISGIWTGKLITYDWSGKEIDNESDLRLEITDHNDSVQINWIEGKEHQYQFYAIKKNKAWHVRKYHALVDSITITKVITQIKFDVRTLNNIKTLNGNARIFSSYTKDQLKPNSFSLRKEENDNNVASSSTYNVSILSIYPNPFRNQLQVSIKLINPDCVTINIYDLMGNKVYTHKATDLKDGNHLVKLNTGSLQDGQYIVHVKGQNEAVSNIILKSKN